MKNYLKSIGAVKCGKCQDVWVHESGRLDSKMKDEKGKPLTAYICFRAKRKEKYPKNSQAAESYAQFRARCPKTGCGNVFCVKCGAE